MQTTTMYLGVGVVPSLVSLFDNINVATLYSYDCIAGIIPRIRASDKRM